MSQIMHLCPTLPGWWWVGILKGGIDPPAACLLGGALPYMCFFFFSYYTFPHKGSVRKEMSYTVGRNPLWNPETHSEIQKSTLKSGNPIQDPIKILTNVRILYLHGHACAWIFYDLVAITSMHNKWSLLPANLRSGKKVIFWGDVIAICQILIHVLCITIRSLVRSLVPSHPRPPVGDVEPGGVDGWEQACDDQWTRI